RTTDDKFARRGGVGLAVIAPGFPVLACRRSVDERRTRPIQRSAAAQIGDVSRRADGYESDLSEQIAGQFRPWFAAVADCEIELIRRQLDDLTAHFHR